MPPRRSLRDRWESEVSRFDRPWVRKPVVSAPRCRGTSVSYSYLRRMSSLALPKPSRILTGIESNALMHYVARPEFWSRTSSLERGGQTEPGLDVASQVSANFEEGALFGMGYCNHV